MKAISVRQPWPWAMFNAGKKIENRTWATHYRGPILIHAAKGLTKREYEDFAEWWNFSFPRRPLQSYPLCPAMASLPRGGIVGRAKLVDCVTKSDSPWFFGPYGFVLEDVTPLPFVPMKGDLGVFEVPESLING